MMVSYKKSHIISSSILLALDFFLRKLSPLLGDRVYVKWHYFLRTGKKLRLDNPLTFNEKLQWLKIYDRHESYTRMVDKYEVKKYVSEILGEDYIIPTLGVWNSWEEIDFSTLPEQFVLKCTHDSQSTVICKDKSTFNLENAKRIINTHLKKNYYWQSREYPYKDLRGRIIAEKYMVDESENELKDYKFFCFNGEPKMLLLISGRYVDQRQDFYDMNFNLLPVQRRKHPNSGIAREIPKGFDSMKELAAQLSKGIPHVRVDFYNINGKIYFGEFTFFSAGGNLPFEPDIWDRIIGDWLVLPNK